VPNKIRAFRDARGMSLEKLAKLVNTSNQQISHLESGKRRLTVDWLQRLGRALDCHPWVLVGEDFPSTLQPSEIRLLEAFRGLGKEHRKALVSLAAGVRKAQGSALK
jgi:transcriptional regulator with XRE-family HTH domain